MMADKNITRRFKATGTTCESCERIIKKQAMKVPGVKSVDFDYSTERGTVIFDRKKTDLDTIFKKIEEKGYSCSRVGAGDRRKGPTAIDWIIGTIGVVVIGYFLFTFVDGIQLPEISANMGYGLLFLVGLLTGFHCIAMCGGFVVSYTAKDAKEGRSSHKSHIMYGVGKTLSYTIIGAVFGLIGSLIAFTPAMRGVAGILAGLFLVLFGFKMLNIFPALRKFQLRLPRAVARFVGKEHSKNASPLVIGLLNGLMIACGPLQAIYIMAAGTGSMVEGAKLLFIFGLGTLPVMLGFGYFASFVSSKMTHKILKASGVIVILLGLIMLNRGLALAGTGYDINSLKDSITGASIGTASSDVPLLVGGVQEIRMDVTRNGWEPDRFVLQKDVPVRWIVNGKEITGCNNAIQVPKYGLEFDIKPGEQVIEFTPTEEGVVPWSCWMGMIPGTFIVKDDLTGVDEAQIQKELASAPVKPAGSCGGACGGSGCGCGCGAR